MLIQMNIKNLNLIILFALTFLIICVLFSTFIRGYWFNNFTGDTQRFNGTISLLALITVLIASSNISQNKINNYLK